MMDDRNQISADQGVAESVATVVAMFQELRLDYALFGSCGIQTYFDCFFRLPNDIDVIVRKEAISKLKAYCTQLGHTYEEELGRSKLHINGFPVHIIPECFSCIDKVANTVFARIDLSTFISNAVTKQVNLPCASTSPIVNVVCFEMCLFMDLIRPVNTNSLLTSYFVFRHIDIDEGEFGAIVRNNILFATTIVRRLNECANALSGVTYFSKGDIRFAQNKMADMRRTIERLQSQAINYV
ncbi:MAG TPA: hypothetical protein VJU86_01090 [Pyrinomonadaceae bacterium]|nr:hypothetical protein [Pyrinomonadaceae bacterium]